MLLRKTGLGISEAVKQVNRIVPPLGGLIREGCDRLDHRMLEIAGLVFEGRYSCQLVVSESSMRLINSPYEVAYRGIGGGLVEATIALADEAVKREDRLSILTLALGMGWSDISPNK